VIFTKCESIWGDKPTMKKTIMSNAEAQQEALKKYPLSNDEDISITNIRLNYYYDLIDQKNGRFLAEDVMILNKLCQD